MDVDSDLEAKQVARNSHRSRSEFMPIHKAWERSQEEWKRLEEEEEG